MRKSKVILWFYWYKANHFVKGERSCKSLRIHWRFSTILKTSNKSVLNVFWYVKVYIFWKCIQYTIHWDKTQIFKKFPLDKTNGTKNAFSLLLRAPTHHSFISLKLRVGISIFDSASFLLKFIFLFNKMSGPFDFKTS